MSEFKVGDEVYYPSVGLGIYKLEATGGAIYPLSIRFCDFTFDGKSHVSRYIPAIFHATEENKKTLELLMGVEFESPKKKGSDLTRQMLSESGVPILCYVSDISDEYAIQAGYTNLIGAMDDDRFVALFGVTWRYAVPYDKDFRTALT